MNVHLTIEKNRFAVRKDSVSDRVAVGVLQ